MAADPSEVTPRDRRNQRILALWWFVWFICMLGAQALFRFRRDLVPPGATSWLVKGLPMVAGAVVVWFYVRYLREADELQRRIQSNALALGFGVTFFWTTTYNSLESVGAMKMDPRFLILPGASAYFLTVLYGKWQYR
jgi:hypothetical protein